jgi:hypothetical protein
VLETETDTSLRRRAERRVNARLGFRYHAMAFVLVNGGLALLNLMTAPRVLWFLWPLFGWGIGLAAHGLAVHGAGGESRERAVAAEMERLERRG